MTDHDLSITFFVDQTPEAAFAAIRDVTRWWGEGIEGSTAALGDVFDYRHEELHRSRQRLVDVVPARRLEWLVLDDAWLSFVADRAEWKGTRLRFELVPQPDGTEVRFTHVGLDRTHECFDTCSKAWGFYVGESLRSLIETGKGKPDSREKGRAR